MIRFISLLLLLIWWPGPIHAEVYQCLTQEGILFLTNNKNKFPPDCQEVGGSLEGETMASPPTGHPNPDQESTRKSSTPSPAPAEEPQSADSSQAKEAPAGGLAMTHSKELEMWRGLAQSMATRFEALNKAPGTPSEKAEKYESLERNLRIVLDSLETSPLTEEERAEIKAVLPAN